MNIQGRHYRTIWLDPEDQARVQIIDQRHLPFRFTVETLTSVDDMITAISDMHVRGAGLIGAAAGYGMYLAALSAPAGSKEAFFEHCEKAGEKLKRARPTAVNLEWAVERQLRSIRETSANPDTLILQCMNLALDIADEDADFCRRIGEYGRDIITRISSAKKGKPVNILTHCNAGALAFVDYGTATAPIYAAHNSGIPVHVWVDETRPRNQGARLTAWELGQHGVPHTIIADNTGGHLMQHDMVDLVITGADRVTRTGDAANKIGTYLKALAAKDNGIPFYVALPSSTFDWKLKDGVREIPFEERHADEVAFMEGGKDGEVLSVRISPGESGTANFAFDVTPSRLISGLITERGVCGASESGIFSLFPEKSEEINKKG